MRLANTSNVHRKVVAALRKWNYILGRTATTKRHIKNPLHLIHPFFIGKHVVYCTKFWHTSQGGVVKCNYRAIHVKSPAPTNTNEDPRLFCLWQFRRGFCRGVKAPRLAQGEDEALGLGQRRMWMNPREVLPYPIGDSPADSNPYYRMKYTDPCALWVSTGPYARKPSSVCVL